MLLGKGRPWQECFVINSQINPIQLQVLISSKKIHNFFSKYFWSNFCFSILINCSEWYNSSASFKILLLVSFLFCSRKSTISLSVIPAWIFSIFILLFPLFISSDNFLISDVLPHPVSPIIIVGIFSLILNNINIILIKLSAVKTYSPTISSIDFRPFLFVSSFLSLFKTGFLIFRISFISYKKSLWV